MSDDPTLEIHDSPGGETAEYPALSSGPDLADGMPVEPSAGFDDEQDDWPTRGPAKGIRLAAPAAALVAVVLVGAGFWGGATLQKRQGSSSSSQSSAAAALVARLRNARAGASGATGATGATGFGAGGLGFGGGASSGTAGTISVVDDKTLYVLTAEGALVKVALGPSTTVTRNAKAQADGLRPGDTVVVQGSAAANGTVSATSVAATAAGVTSTGGGFGGRFGNAGAEAGTGGG